MVSLSFLSSLQGDTINAASRMSTTASAGQIQLSHRSWELLNKDWYRTEYRGEIQVKGKGMMKTYLLLEKTAQCPPPTSVEQVQRANGTLEHNAFHDFDNDGSNGGGGGDARHEQTHQSPAVHPPLGSSSCVVPSAKSLPSCSSPEADLTCGVTGAKCDALAPGSNSALAPLLRVGSNEVVEMVPAQLPGVPEFLQKVRAGVVGREDSPTVSLNSRHARETSLSTSIVAKASVEHGCEDVLRPIATSHATGSDDEILPTILSDAMVEVATPQPTTMFDQFPRMRADSSGGGGFDAIDLASPSQNTGAVLGTATVSGTSVSASVGTGGEKLIARSKLASDAPRLTPLHVETPPPTGAITQTMQYPSHHQRSHKVSHGSTITQTQTSSIQSSLNSVADSSIGGDEPSKSNSSTRSASSHEHVVITAMNHQSEVNSIRLFSFGSIAAILRPKRVWYHRLSQTFITDPMLEAEFLQLYARDQWFINRTVVNFMWIFLLPLSIYDTLNNTELSSSTIGYAWLIRLVGIGVGVWFYYYSQRPNYLARMQEISCFTVTTVGIVYICTTSLTSALLKSYGVSFSLMILCLICMFLGLRFYFALLACTILMCVWAIAAIVSEHTFPGIASVLFAGAVMYLESCWNMENDARHDFIRFKKLYHERMSTHSFLTNMLPSVVFEQLRRVDLYSSSSSSSSSLSSSLVAHERMDSDVLFSDIVGFTSVASTLRPEDVVAILNVMFASFDMLATKHGVYKVETIGDAYVACTNVVELSRDHTKRMCDFALAMQRATKSMYTPTEQQIIIRVGIHTGSVIAGVVGRKMPRYHLHGSTVTIAELMEQKGVPGMVVLSEASFTSMPSEALVEYDFKQLNAIPHGDTTIARFTIEKAKSNGRGHITPHESQPNAPPSHHNSPHMKTSNVRRLMIAKRSSGGIMAANGQSPTSAKRALHSGGVTFTPPSSFTAIHNGAIVPTTSSPAANATLASSLPPWKNQSRRATPVFMPGHDKAFVPQ